MTAALKCGVCGVPDPQNRRAYYSRGLCRTCYHRAKRRGELINYERPTRPREELLQEWDELRRDGWTREHAAARIGVTKAALEKAIERAKKDAA